MNLGIIGAFDHPTSVILKAHSDLGAQGWQLDPDMAHPLRQIPGVQGVYVLPDLRGVPLAGVGLAFGPHGVLLPGLAQDHHPPTPVL